MKLWCAVCKDGAATMACEKLAIQFSSVAHGRICIGVLYEVEPGQGVTAVRAWFRKTASLAAPCASVLFFFPVGHNTKHETGSRQSRSHEHRHCKK